MSKNYEDYGYEDENEVEETYQKSPVAKKALIIILIVIAILIIVYLIKGCTKNDVDKPVVNNDGFDYESALIKAGKSYYENNAGELPSSVGECTEVKLDKLIEKGLVDPDKFSKCNIASSYVRVCLLSNGNKHYSPWLTCEDKMSESEYEPSREGNISDVIADSTYVNFEFLPQVLKSEGATYGAVEELWKEDIRYNNYKTLSTTNYYRYRDKLYKWNLITNHYFTRNGESTNANDVKEYYLTAPDSEHKYYDNATNDAYKWYEPIIGDIYHRGANGSKDYSPIAPEGYPYNINGVTGYFSREMKNETFSPILYYECAADANSTTVVHSTTPCEERTNSKVKYTKRTFFSCVDRKVDPNAELVGTEVYQTEICTAYTEWKQTSSCDPEDTKRCKKVTVYQWYKKGEVGRTYYPSKSATASGEKVFYKESPCENCVKDEESRVKVYKWYRTTSKVSTEYTATAPSGYSKATKTGDFKVTDWSEWTTSSVKVNDGRDRIIETKTKIKLQPITGASSQNWESLTENDTYLPLDDMLNVFRDNKFPVNSLTDINNNGEIRYQVKMLIRNKKETNR